MCYFARKDFLCGDWKWGNMVERCPRQHRIGETCGAKLVATDHIDPRMESCKTCQEIAVKKRRLEKVLENISRWTAEKGRFSALLEKAENERDVLVDKIRELESQRPSIVYRGGADRVTSASRNMPPPSPMLPMEGGSSYTWSTQSRSYTTSNPMVSGYSSANSAAVERSKTGVPSRHTVTYSQYTSRR